MLDIMAGGRMGLQGLLNEAFTCPLKGLLKAATAIVTATAASRLLPLRLLTQAYYSHYHCCLASSCRTSYRVKHVYLSLSVPISIHPPYLSLSLSMYMYICLALMMSTEFAFRYMSMSLFFRIICVVPESQTFLHARPTHCCNTSGSCHVVC